MIQSFGNYLLHYQESLPWLFYRIPEARQTRPAIFSRHSPWGICIVFIPQNELLCRLMNLSSIRQSVTKWWVDRKYLPRGKIQEFFFERFEQYSDRRNPVPVSVSGIRPIKLSFLTYFRHLALPSWSIERIRIKITDTKCVFIMWYWYVLSEFRPVFRRRFLLQRVRTAAVIALDRVLTTRECAWPT